MLKKLKVKGSMKTCKNRTNTKKDVLFIIGDWNAKVGSQETPGCCCAKSLQSCPALCDPIDGSLPGSPVPGILQARILQWVAISFSNAPFPYHTQTLFFNPLSL